MFKYEIFMFFFKSTKTYRLEKLSDNMVKEKKPVPKIRVKTPFIVEKTPGIVEKTPQVPDVHQLKNERKK